MKFKNHSDYELSWSNWNGHLMHKSSTNILKLVMYYQMIEAESVNSIYFIGLTCHQSLDGKHFPLTFPVFTLLHVFFT